MIEYITSKEMVEYVLSDFCTFSEGQIREILYSMI